MYARRLWRRIGRRGTTLLFLALVALLLAYEHSLVRPSDLSRIDAAFFTANAWVSVAYFACTLLAVSYNRVP